MTFESKNKVENKIEEVKTSEASNLDATEDKIVAKREEQGERPRAYSTASDVFYNGAVRNFSENSVESFTEMEK
jgi:hypothetical protein